MINLHTLKWFERRLAREFRPSRVWDVDGKYWSRLERHQRQRWPLNRHARNEARANAYHATQERGLV